MSQKSMFGIAIALSGSLVLAGCGGDDCTQATDHKAECAANPSPTTTASSNPPSSTLACSGVLLCQSQCVIQSTCQQINGLAQSYQDCLTGCAGK